MTPVILFPISGIKRNMVERVQIPNKMFVNQAK